MMSNLKIAAGVFALLVLAPTMALADDYRRPLEKASLEFRQAAIDFEYFVDHSRYFHSTHRRLADDLEDATDHLKSAARRPDRPERLYRALDKVKRAKQKIQDVFFTGHHSKAHYELVRHWERVICGYDLFVRELELAVHRPLIHPISVPRSSPAYRNDYRGGYRPYSYDLRSNSGIGLSIRFGR